MRPLKKTGERADQPLCLNQEQLLLSREWMQRYATALPPALINTALTLRGPLKQDALEGALNGLVERHAALRVRFYPAPEIAAPEREHRLRQFGQGIYVPGLYQQSVARAVPVTVHRVDLTHLSSAQADQKIRELLQEEMARAFDYAHPPLLRATLIARGPDDHLLILVADHTVIDAWSMRLLRKELVILYQHFCGESRHALPAPGLSYPDYAAWQHEAIATSGFDSAVAYWTQQWKRYGPHRVAFGDLPFARPMQGQPGLSFGMAQVQLAPETCGKIRAFARLSRVSLNMFFLAVYAAVLQSYTQKYQLGLWSHFANRSRPEVQHTVGHFVHSHLIGLDFSPDLTGTDLLWQVRRAVLEAYEHQEMPLAHLWRTINSWPRYADARVLLDFHQADEPWEEWPLSGGLAICRAKLQESQTPRFSSLGVYVRDSQDGMSLSIQYSKNRFSEPAIRDMLEDLQSVTAYFLASPDQKLRDCFPVTRYQVTAGTINRMADFVTLQGAATATATAAGTLG